MKVKFLSSLIPLAGVAALLFAPLATIAVTNNTASVSVLDNYYSPQNLTVPMGTTVTWTNMGMMNHTVTSTSGLFDSGTMAPGATFSYTFTTAGTFSYYCRFHNMSGVVVVTNLGGGSTNNSISGTVSSSSSGTLTVNQITPVKTIGIADGTFANGWQYIFDITAPYQEQNLAMQFNDWMAGNATMPVANNIRFFSAQSSNASSENTAIYVNAPNTYSSPMYLTGDLGGSSGRHIQITVEVRIPPGTANGTYASSFGIQTSPTPLFSRSSNQMNTSMNMNNQPSPNYGNTSSSSGY